MNRVVNNQGGTVANGCQERGGNTAYGCALGSAGPAADHGRQQRTNVYTLFYSGNSANQTIIVALELSQKCGINEVTLPKTSLFINDCD